MAGGTRSWKCLNRFLPGSHVSRPGAQSQAAPLPFPRGSELRGEQGEDPELPSSRADSLLHPTWLLFVRARGRGAGERRLPPLRPAPTSYRLPSLSPRRGWFTCRSARGTRKGARSCEPWLGARGCARGRRESPMASSLLLPHRARLSGRGVTFTLPSNGPFSRASGPRYPDPWRRGFRPRRRSPAVSSASFPAQPPPPTASPVLSSRSRHCEDRPIRRSGGAATGNVRTRGFAGAKARCRSPPPPPHTPLGEGAGNLFSGQVRNLPYGLRGACSCCSFSIFWLKSEFSFGTTLYVTQEEEEEEAVAVVVVEALILEFWLHNI